MKASFATAIISLIVMNVLLVGCDYNREKGARIPKDPGTSPQAKAAIGYALVYEQVLKPRCLQCHSSAGGNQGHTNLEGYPATFALLERIRFRSLVDRTMPPGQALPSAEAKLLETWIAKGAPESANSTGSGAPGSNGFSEHPIWTEIRDGLFAQSCLRCHASPSPEAGLDLSSLHEVRRKAGRIFERAVVAQDMPLAPFPRWTPEEKRAFTTWVLEGMTE